MAEVELITANEAAARAGVGSRTIYQWIENGTIHFIEDLGVLLVCAASLCTSMTRTEVLDNCERHI